MSRYWPHLMACIAGLLLMSSPSQAGTVGYTISGSMPSSIPLTAVSEPGTVFVLSFNVPSPVSVMPGTIPGGFDVSIPSATLVFGGSAI
ncbi:MAG: hypothetical protein QM757_25150 [Paludibaculum sp.]